MFALSRNTIEKRTVSHYSRTTSPQQKLVEDVLESPRIEGRSSSRVVSSLGLASLCNRLGAGLCRNSTDSHQSQLGSNHRYLSRSCLRYSFFHFHTDVPADTRPGCCSQCSFQCNYWSSSAHLPKQLGHTVATRIHFKRHAR